MRLGLRNTKFFYAHATNKHRRNVITSLTSSAGNVFFTHDEKATLLWEAYKERLATSKFKEMLFDLPDLLNLVDDLEWLEGPFSKKKIDDIIAQIPSDKSPGPDRFNIDFMKRC